MHVRLTDGSKLVVGVNTCVKVCLCLCDSFVIDW